MVDLLVSYTVSNSRGFHVNNTLDKLTFRFGIIAGIIVTRISLSSFYVRVQKPLKTNLLSHHFTTTILSHHFTTTILSHHFTITIFNDMIPLFMR